jgi:diguanylate cyclase (GGDEF)-like protein
VLKEVEAISIGSAKEALPNEHIEFSLRAGDLFYGTRPDISPEKQFLIRENLNACIDALEQYNELANKYARLKRDYRSILESSERVDFEKKQFKNLALFLGKTKQFGVLDSTESILADGLSEHTIQIVQRQLQSNEEYSVRVATGELYACKFGSFIIIVERDSPLSSTEKNHIKLTAKYISLQRTQNSLKEAMASLLEDDNHSEGITADNIESSLQKCLDNLVREATVDPLTLAFNRRYLLKHVENLYRTNAMFSTIIIDIDYFKVINDTYGHEQGDQVLCEFVDVVSEVTRADDVVARWGGEEFLIILETAELKTALARAEVMRQAVENHKFKTGCSITASFGVASREPQSNDFNELVKIADEALYRAKANGRNRVER